MSSPSTGRYTIYTRGDQAHGMVAQSVGGGGGLMADENGLIIRDARTDDQKRGQARGAGGAITIDTHGNILADGKNAYGILAQSGVQTTTGSLDPSHAGGNIRITHHGILSGGSGDGAAIFIDGGHDNIVTIRPGSYVSALSGMAIKGSFGSDTVHNMGVVLGKVDLVGNLPAQNRANNFHNGSDGALSMLDMRLGSGGKLLNDGLINLGHPGEPTVVELDGNFEQGRTGQLLIDVSPSAGPGELTSDYLKVSGSAVLQGIVWSDSVTALLPGNYPFLEAGTELQVGELNTPANWDHHVPIGWTVARRDNQLSLVPWADFAGVDGVTLTDNQRQVAAHLQEAWDQGMEPHAGVFARLLETGSAQDYARTLDSLGPETLQASAVTRLHASRVALKSVLSCPSFVDNGTLMREGDCVWSRVSHRRIDQDRSADSLGYRIHATSYQMGVQREWNPGWFVGMSAAYTDTRLRSNGNLLRSAGDSFDAAFALKREIGNWTLAGSLAAGYGRFDNRRSLYVGNDVLQANSRSNVYTMAGRLRAAYQFNGARGYVSPRVDLDVIHTRKPGYTEYGAGSLNLEVSAMRDTTLALRPAIEVGGRYELKSAGWVRPYANVGVTIMSDDALTSRANFTGHGSGSRDFITSSRITRVLGDVGVGVQMQLGKRYELSAEYQAQLGRHYTAHQGTARLSIRF